MFGANVDVSKVTYAIWDSPRDRDPLLFEFSLYPSEYESAKFEGCRISYSKTLVEVVSENKQTEDIFLVSRGPGEHSWS